MDSEGESSRKQLDGDNLVLHAQLTDGSRLAVAIPPVVRSAPALTIRKIEYPNIPNRIPQAFRLDLAASEGALNRVQSPSKGNRERTNFEHDWACVLPELAHGKDGLGRPVFWPKAVRTTTTV
jgi:hypothetical protein